LQLPLSLTLSVVTAIIGVFLLGIGTIGFYKAQVHWILRIVAMAGALGLMIPGLKSDLVGLAVLVGLHLLQSKKAKRAKASPAEPVCEETKD